MTLYEAVRSILAAAGPVTAIAGDRIRPDKLAEGDQVPAIAIGVEDSPLNDFEGATGAGEAKIILKAWATDRSEADSLMKQAAAALHATSGVAGLGLDIWDEDAQGDVEPGNDNSDENDWYCVERQFTALYQET